MWAIKRSRERPDRDTKWDQIIDLPISWGRLEIEIDIEIERKVKEKNEKYCYQEHDTRCLVKFILESSR